MVPQLPIISPAPPLYVYLETRRGWLHFHHHHLIGAIWSLSGACVGAGAAEKKAPSCGWRKTTAAGGCCDATVITVGEAAGAVGGMRWGCSRRSLTALRFLLCLPRCRRPYQPAVAEAATSRGISAAFGIIRIFIIFCINTHYIYTPLRRGSVADLLAQGHTHKLRMHVACPCASAHTDLRPFTAHGPFTAHVPRAALSLSSLGLASLSQKSESQSLCLSEALLGRSEFTRNSLHAGLLAVKYAQWLHVTPPGNTLKYAGGDRARGARHMAREPRVARDDFCLK